MCAGVQPDVYAYTYGFRARIWVGVSLRRSMLAPFGKINQMALKQLN